MPSPCPHAPFTLSIEDLCISLFIIDIPCHFSLFLIVLATGHGVTQKKGARETSAIASPSPCYRVAAVLALLGDELAGEEGTDTSGHL